MAASLSVTFICSCLDEAVSQSVVNVNHMRGCCRLAAAWEVVSWPGLDRIELSFYSRH